MKATGVPFLIVTGGWSPAFDVASDTAAELGGARRLMIRSPHHFPQLISEEFNTEFLSLVRRGGGDAGPGVTPGRTMPPPDHSTALHIFPVALRPIGSRPEAAGSPGPRE